MLLEEEILEQERDAERMKRERDEAIREREELSQEKETLALNFARTLLKMGLPVAEVARQTGLSEERVRGMQ
ncbi:MAG: hypothetical protein CSA07_00230 [Bacteroidia bacterium]|nr:MAG: hypothetical protein CSA07_00230 [Bacteroidia bacterium]